jgi:hypothetical protein
MPSAHPLVQRAHDLSGIRKAFRPFPLSAAEMEFYSDSLNRLRGTELQHSLTDALLECADEEFYFKRVFYGHRGSGKSTEINRLLEQPAINNASSSCGWMRSKNSTPKPLGSSTSCRS